MTRGQRAGRWVGRRVARRIEKALPLVGTIVAMAFLAETMRRKGVMRGLADTALNAVPVLGTVKNGIEMFTDDWIPDRRVPATSSPSTLAPPRRSRPGRRTRGG